MTITSEQLREWADWLDSCESSDPPCKVNLPELGRAHAAALEEIERLKGERDAAFAMSKCECGSNECCANLVKAQERADIDAYQLAVMTEMAGANHAAWKQAERRAERLKGHAEAMEAELEFIRIGAQKEGKTTFGIGKVLRDYRAEFKGE